MAKFSPGQSGNPGGVSKIPPEVRELARKHTKAAIDKLATIMNKGQSEQAQISAASILLDRGWGKPTQPISGDDHAPAIKLDPRAELLNAIASIASSAAKDGGSHETETGDS